MQANNLSARERAVAAISQAIRSTTPSTAELKDWHECYVATHLARLTTDVEMVITQAQPQGLIVEIGAIPLVVTCALKLLGYRVIGLDVNPERYWDTIAEQSLDVRKCDIERDILPVESNTASLILFNEVFEHLRIDLIATLSEVLRILEPNGRMLMSTPNLRSWRGLRRLLLSSQANAIGGSLYEEYRKLHSLGHMGHVREYTFFEVATFLRAVGFDINGVMYRGAESRTEKILARVRPSLLPFMTIEASKRSPAR